MRKTLLLASSLLGLVACQQKPVETPAPEPVVDTVKTVVDTVANDPVVPVAPRLPMYDTEIFSYDTAYFVDPNNQQHKFVKYKTILVMPSRNDSDKLVNDIRFDIMHFAADRVMTDPVVATAGYFAAVATQFKTEFRAANDFSKSRYFDWSVARFTKLAYQDSRLFCVAKGLYENKGNNPLYGLSYSNWDKKLKEKIEFETLFYEKDVEDIRGVLVDCMVKSYGVADEASLETKGISPEQISPSNKFLLTKDTIYFVYSPYELGVDAERSIKIPVANKQLGQYMDKSKSIVRYLLED